MKFGAKQNCMVNDLIDVNISPADLTNVIQIVEERALSETDYDSQGMWRSIKDFLQKRYDEWEKVRLEKDRKNKTS